MKKYRVKDADGSTYEITETECDESPEIVDEDFESDVHDEDSLTPKEISALKRLAGCVDQLISLLQTTDSKEGVEDDELSEEPDVIDEDPEIVDEDVVEDDGEEVVDTDEKLKKDSKSSRKSYGSKLKPSRDSKDNFNDKALEIEKAWTKRYGGK